MNEIELTGFAYNSERSELFCFFCTEYKQENSAPLNCEWV